LPSDRRHRCSWCSRCCCSRPRNCCETRVHRPQRIAAERPPTRKWISLVDCLPDTRHRSPSTIECCTAMIHHSERLCFAEHCPPGTFGCAENSSCHNLECQSRTKTSDFVRRSCCGTDPHNFLSETVNWLYSR
jgi:hypothetical protein